MPSLQEDEERLIAQALESARDTRSLHVAAGARQLAGAFFEREFGRVPAVVIADPRTFAAAGADVLASIRRQGLDRGPPIILDDPKLYAEYSYVDEIMRALADRPGVPIAVGSGTINDLVKLVAHRLDRAYLAVATAASMDGYTAYGASITRDELKQTFDCPAPAAVLADLDVIAQAPEGLNASGYADLAAKIAAGADWLVADALGVEALDPPAWSMVQRRLRWWLADPAGIRNGVPESTRRLTTGLLMGGFAMQRTKTSRPASGAEHQFSHLWDMQHHIFNGRPPSHGFKVGIGTLASIALYEQLLALPLDQLDIDACRARWPDRAQALAEARDAFETTELTECAVRETSEKYLDREALRSQLARLRDVWPELRTRLREHLIPFAELRRMLDNAGCPVEPSQIGISRERLKQSYRQASYIRRRFTVLDLANRTGLLDHCLDRLFADGGVWEKGTPPHDAPES